MTRLSININKIALIRNSRGSNLPDICQVAKDIEAFGGEGITVHPRPDQRHIRFDDIPKLKEIVTTELNIEGYPSPDFMKMVLENVPAQVTLVPDPPDALTSNTGWDTVHHAIFLTEILSAFREAGIRTSLFVNADPAMVSGAKKIGADRVELYTGPYAAHYHKNKEEAIKPYFEASKEASILGIGLNAGHDLNLDNTKYFKQNTVELLEVSIGHALVCDALYYGLKNIVLMYKNLLR